MELPTTKQLLSHPIVQAAFEVAWADSFPDIEPLRHEEGGWIIGDVQSGRITIRRELPGKPDELEFVWPDVAPPLLVLAAYHTHAKPISTGEKPDPSQADRNLSRDWKIPSFVIAESAIFIISTDGSVSLGELK